MFGKCHIETGLNKRNISYIILSQISFGKVACILTAKRTHLRKRFSSTVQIDLRNFLLLYYYYKMLKYKEVK